MSESKTPMKDAFGAETTDRLAAWAIDALLEPPEEISTGSTRLPTSLVARGREELDGALDWRALKRKIQEGDRGSASSWRRRTAASS